MKNWFLENIGNLAVIFILLLTVSAILFKMIKDKKQGKSSCGCNCSHCPMSGKCHNKSDEK